MGDEQEQGRQEVRREAEKLTSYLGKSMAAYNRDQWIGSFEGQLSPLRPLLRTSVLAAISSLTWDEQGLDGVDPVDAAKRLSAEMSRPGPPTWSTPVTKELRDRLRLAGETALRNAVAILGDAKLLRANSRLARAKALAILADEEFAKALALRSCASQGRWDSAVVSVLIKHTFKQGIAHVARRYFTWLERNLAMVEQLNRGSLIRVTPALFPGEELWKAMIEEGRVTNRDRAKQAALYVAVGKNGQVAENPANTSEEDADRCIADADCARRFVEAMDSTMSDERARMKLRAAGVGDSPDYIGQL
jgi:AbiV family abortive infection protein